MSLISFFSSLLSGCTKSDSPAPPKAEAAQKAEWLVAKSSGKGGALCIFRYLSAKPAGWKSSPLSEEVSITWRFEGAMPDETIQNRMNGMEDLLESLSDSKDSCLALVITAAGMREWCFYCRDYPAFMAGLNKCFAGKPAFPIEINHSHDPDWTYWHNFVDMAVRK